MPPSISSVQSLDLYLDFSSELLDWQLSVFGREIRSVNFVMHAAFDSSGNCASDSTLAVAGYFGYMESTWATFSNFWPDALRQAGIKRLHTTDYLSAHSDSTLTETETDLKVYELLRPFIDVINRSGIFGISAALDCPGYARLSAEQKRVLGMPMVACFELCMESIVANVGQARETQPLVITFDLEDQLGPLYGAFRRVKKRRDFVRNLVKGICFVDDDIYHPLQAADMLAYLGQRTLKNRIGGKKEPLAMEMLRGSGRIHTGLFGYEGLIDRYSRLLP